MSYVYEYPYAFDDDRLVPCYPRVCDGCGFIEHTSVPWTVVVRPKLFEKRPPQLPCPMCNRQDWNQGQKHKHLKDQDLW
jgi:hypothetical protein